MGLKEEIKKTIEYGKKFDCQIDKREIKERLLSNNAYSDKELNDGLKNFKLKKNNNKYLKEKVKKAEKLAKWIKSEFKDILFLGISGSVASNYPKKNDDIDLLIISKENCLWWNRLKLRFLIYIKKIPHRKFGRKEEKDQFCFNLWLDEKGLLLAKEKRNLQNGVDLIMIKNLINKDKTYEKFLLENEWAKKFVATAYKKRINSYLKKERKENKFGIKNKFLNFLCFWPQHLYMKNKITQEKVNYHQAFFHH
jgi:hypothetical protein